MTTASQRRPSRISMKFLTKPWRSRGAWSETLGDQVRRQQHVEVEALALDALGDDPVLADPRADRLVAADSIEGAAPKSRK